MNKAVQALLERQLQERKDFCGFATEPTDVETAILELVQRFQGINQEVALLLQPWFPKYKVGPAVEKLIFEGKLAWDWHTGSLRIPKMKK